MSETRSYQSPLRAEQAERTREKLLEAVLELCLESSAIGLTVTAAAERAAVSPRTAYRYFPTLEALLDDFATWVWAKILPLKYPKDLGELMAFVPVLYAYFVQNTRYFRAARAVTTAKTMGGQLRARRKAQQLKDLGAILAPVTAGAPAGEAKTLAATVHTLLSLDAFWNLTEVWGMTTAEAATTTTHALERMLAPWRKRK